MKTSVRRLIQLGASLVVSLPQSMWKEWCLKRGNCIEFVYDKKIAILRPYKTHPIQRKSK